MRTSNRALAALLTAMAAITGLATGCDLLASLADALVEAQRLKHCGFDLSGEWADVDPLTDQERGTRFTLLENESGSSSDPPFADVLMFYARDWDLDAAEQAMLDEMPSEQRASVQESLVLGDGSATYATRHYEGREYENVWLGEPSDTSDVVLHSQPYLQSATTASSIYAVWLAELTIDNGARDLVGKMTVFTMPEREVDPDYEPEDLPNWIAVAEYDLRLRRVDGPILGPSSGNDYSCDGAREEYGHPVLTEDDLVPDDDDNDAGVADSG